MLLCLLTRDNAVNKMRALNEGAPPSVKLLDWMDHLLNRKWSSSVKNGLSFCSHAHDGKNAFKEAFKEAIIYFTQFIKVHSADVINHELLWGAVARGAAIICHDNQRGVALVIPFLIRDEPVGQKTVSAILIQVKSDSKYGAKPHETLFDGMDPHVIGLFGEEETNTLPIIRMVFALAAKSSNIVTFQRPADQQIAGGSNPKQNKAEANRKPSKAEAKSAVPEPTKSDPSTGFIAYDIWCAQTSKNTFGVIEDDTTYEKLLKINKTFPRSYQATPVELEEKSRRQMHPMAFAEKDHWTFLVPKSQRSRRRR